MSKKGLSAHASVLLIILLTLISVGIAWVVVENIVPPNFKITKEICEEEIFKQNIVLFQELPNGTRIILSHWNTSSDQTDVFLGVSRITCHEEEVDEIEYKPQEPYLDVCLIYSNGTKYCGENLKTIPKKDLTTEWLDKNAECVEGYFKEQNSLCSTEANGCIPKDYDECWEYKLGNYIIEVKR